MDLNTEPLDWESINLTTRPLLHKLELELALEAEIRILPIDIRLQELNRIECLKLSRKNDKTLKDKLLASFRNPKLYPSSLQNIAKQGTRLLSHLIGQANIDINKIRVEKEPSTF